MGLQDIVAKANEALADAGMGPAESVTLVNGGDVIPLES
jgi:hypothetical protein